MNFSEILGNEKIKNDLEQTVKKNTTAHSYLFIGDAGIGKKMVAKDFARMILCQGDEADRACGRCSSCIKFDSSNNPDYFEIEPDGNSLKISQIREMLENIYQKPIISNKKVFIINDCEKMTKEAQNSLLKTLEEPPEYIVIILITSNENMILNTVKSRCIKIKFDNLTNYEMQKYIEKDKDEDVKKIGNMLLEMCNGSIGKLIKVSKNVDEYNKIEEATKNFVNGNIRNTIQMLKNFEILYSSKEIILDLLDYMIVIIYQYISKRSDCMGRILNTIPLIEKTKRKLVSNSNYDMCLDELILNM